jgi:FKBP-type peptidyl-prolyl cis-trans isomerase FklB
VPGWQATIPLILRQKQAMQAFDKKNNQLTLHMKQITLAFALILVALNLSAQKNPSNLDKKEMKPLTLKNDVDSANYAYGMVLASNAGRQLGGDMNKEAILEGFRAALYGEQTVMTTEQSNKVFQDYNKASQKRAIDKNKLEGQRFLDENKKRKEVTTTASGLQYEVLKKGTGTTHPLATDKVQVHYHGTLLNGTVFDSSVDRGQPATFPLNGVIKGWTEGVQYMKEGDKFKFFIPSDLAYGERGAGGQIKPGATLIFEVELLKINPQ